MMQVPSEEHDEGTVVEEFHKGYKLFDKVIRHAKVSVSSGKVTRKEPDEREALDADDEQEGED
jgi:ribosomal protein S6